MEAQKKKVVLLQHFSHKEHPLILKKLPQIRLNQYGFWSYDEHHVNRRLINHSCDGCKERISLYGGAYCYRCDECDYDLHKLCAEAPRTINHPLHQEHPLQLLEKPPNEDDVCTTDCCKRPDWKNFTYHCSTCKFNIDIICATTGERKELQHFSHLQHPLVLKKLPPQIIRPNKQDHHHAAINNIGDGEGVNYPGLLNHYCYGCMERISLYYDDDPYCYMCDRGCDYTLHKLCAEAPLSIHHHPLHPDHPLQLLKKPPNDVCTTDCCKQRHWRSFTYHCSTCKFNIDILCATTGERKEFLRHFSHLQHPLVRKKLPPQVIRPNKEDHHHAAINNIGDGSDGLLDHTCKGCFRKISLYGEPYCYRCDRGCDYDLHKLCAEAPLSIQQHPLHQLHPLQLLTRQGLIDYKRSECNVEGSWEGFTYYCSTCEFDIDILCATTWERKFYNPHHNHLLSLFRTITTSCNACGIKDEGAFYHCTTCVHFWLHEDCALLPKQIYIQEANCNTREDIYRHDHPLTIAYSLMDHHAQHSPDCMVCKSKIKRNLWIYGCEKCRYFVHIHCCTMKPTPNLQLSGLSDTFLSRLFGDEPPVLELPLGDEFHSLMEHMLLSLSLNYDNFAKNNEADANIANNIVHDHPLILLYDHLQEDGIIRDDDKNISELTRSIIPLHNPMKRIKLLCNACVRPIAQFPFYRCGGEQQCKDFFLHKWCAELPNELPHRLFHGDQHPLMLLRNVDKFFGIFTCEICTMKSNGFAYGCVGCEYYIDVRCAFMPMSIKHGAHREHLLHLQESKKKQENRESCSGCRWGDWEWMFYCDECNKFKLCPNCAQLPKTMRHKYDKHLLQLMYLPPQDHISQYFCDICEDVYEMNPNEWFYHCADCDQQMHVRCSRISMGIKCGGSITIELHPHRLTFAEWRAESNIKCNKCGDSISLGFCCVQCKYRLHWFCVPDPGKDTKLIRWIDNI